MSSSPTTTHQSGAVDVPDVVSAKAVGAGEPASPRPLPIKLDEYKDISGEDEDDDVDDSDDDKADTGCKQNLRYKIDVSDAHNDLVSRAQSRRFMKELSEDQLRDSGEWHLEDKGDMGSTILHVISDRWNRRLEPLFNVLMMMFPDMYLVEDSLGRTVLDRNQVGRSRDLFAKFFAGSYQKQAAELTRRHPRLLNFLLEALQDTAVWSQILREMPRNTLVRRDISGNTFLHNIVLRGHQQAGGHGRWLLELINQVIDAEPETLTTPNSKGMTAYQYNIAMLRNAWQPEEEVIENRNLRFDPGDGVGTGSIKMEPGDRGSIETEMEKISTVLLEQIYHRLDVNEIRNILHGGGEEVEFDLDLLEFRRDYTSSQPRAFEEILEPLRLRKYLRCVWIPQCNPETMLIVDLFDSLRKKGVTRIMRLEVDEDMDRPHSDEVIIKAIRGFEIQELDWMKTDLCSTVLLEAAPMLQQVCLCSSGSNAVLRSWSATDGLPALTNLTNIRISVIPRVETYESARFYMERFEQRILSVNENLEISVKNYRNRRENESITWSMALSVGIQAQAVQDPRYWASSVMLLQLLREQRHEQVIDMRIAIIDDGIDIDLLKGGTVAAGISFTQSRFGRFKPYYFSSTGQGTQIANLISRFYPGLQLYIARVDSDGEAIRPLIEAVHWSIQYGVQILVFSKTLGQESRKEDRGRELSGLLSALRSAVSKDILVLCPVSDSFGDFLGGREAGFLRIAATKWDENIRQAAPEQADFTFSVKGLDIHKSVSGNSAATAFAAGLAALIMIAGATQAPMPTRRISPTDMKEIFKSLSARDLKYVSVDWLLEMLEKLGGRGDLVLSEIALRFFGLGASRIDRQAGLKQYGRRRLT